MKKIISLLIGLVALCCQPVKAESLALQGTLAPQGQLTITPVDGVYNNLSLSASQTALQVGTVNEKCNKKDGYTVEVQSLNAGAGAQAKLLGTAVGGSPEFINYTII